MNLLCRIIPPARFRSPFSFPSSLPVGFWKYLEDFHWKWRRKPLSGVELLGWTAYQAPFFTKGRIRITKLYLMALTSLPSYSHPSVSFRIRSNCHKLTMNRWRSSPMKGSCIHVAFPLFASSYLMVLSVSPFIMLIFISFHLMLGDLYYYYYYFIVFKSL